MMNPERQRIPRNRVACWAVGALAVPALYAAGAAVGELTTEEQTAADVPAAAASALPSEAASADASPTAEASSALTDLPTFTPSATAESSPAPTTETVVPVPLPSDAVLPTDLPPSTSPDPPETDEFNVGAFNIYYNTNDSDPVWSKEKWPHRLRLSAHVIKKYLDLGALSEVRPVVLQQLQSKNPEDNMLGEDIPDDGVEGAAFGVYPESDVAYASQNPVVWRRSEFEFLEGQTIDGPHVTEPGIHPNSTTLVKLRHKPTDRIVFVFSSHQTVGDAPQYPFAPQARNDNARHRANFDLQLQQEHPDALMIDGADWNSYYNAAPGDRQPTVDNDPQKTAYCLMTNFGGLIDVLDAYEHRNDPELPNKCQPRDIHRVDHIFISNRKWLKVTAYQYGGGENGELNARANGSDVHDTLVATVKVEAAP